MNETPLSGAPLSQVPSDTNSTPIALPQQEQEETNDHHPEEYDPIQQESPLLSVLNVVVDHEMIPPTPLEPQEFVQGDEHVCVPVLRVFGPVLRRDFRYCIEPRQSACLYIHGAFPYLLARPVVAGPDGSRHHNIHGRPSGHTDWDSVESVERILPDLHANLEATIQSSMDFMNPDNDSSTANKKVIRNITVVTGRGFYTYCPGPPAPFLRVEYYDPKLRWKVKLMLERGLNVPRSYHPDPLQYQASLTPPSPVEETSLEPLTFHCYEAHIPYTMQFFKDYNLAGMSYIHLSQAKFRQSLPKTAKRRIESDGDVPPEALFLESNTPTEYVWNEEVTGLQQSMDSDIAFMQQSSAEESVCSPRDNGRTKTPNVDPFWCRKDTSCDIEMDVTVEQILNVKSVMTSLPEDEEERSKIHWRAVPSLREIWRKERQRMSKLLPPKDDFLSHPVDPETPFTLNAKDASTPGARLAVEGMHRLYQPSQGLEEQFRRAMKQIIERHSNSVSQVDDALRCQSSKAPTVPSFLTPPNVASSPQLTPVSHSPPIDDAVDDLGALAGQFVENVDPNMNRDNTSRIENEVVGALEALSSQFSAESGDHSENIDVDALGGLGEQVANNDDPEMSQNDTTGMDYEVFNALEALSSQFAENCDDHREPSDDEGDFLAGTSLTQQHVDSQLTQASVSPYHLLSQQCTQDPFEFSQRVERGDCTAKDPEAHVEDFIDPFTLTPYDDPEDLDDDGFLEEEEDMTEREFEHTLTMLATQTFARERDSHEPDGTDLQEQLLSQQSEQPQYDEADVHLDGDSDNSVQDKSDFTLDEKPKDDKEDEGHAEADFHAQSLAPSEQSHASRASPSGHTTFVSFKGGTILESKDNAPSRIEVENGCPTEGVSKASFYSLGGARTVPRWLPHSTEYGDIRRDLVSRGILVHSLTIPTCVSFEVEPITKAPNRGKVNSWSRKKRKRSADDAVAAVGESKLQKSAAAKAKAVQANSCDWANKDVQIDRNSRKLTAVPQASTNREGSKLSINVKGPSDIVQDLEEVEWEVSQGHTFSMSPPDTEQFQERDNERSAVANGVDPDIFTTDVTSESKQSLSDSSPQSFSESTTNALDGIGQQGGKIFVEGGGGLKAKARSPKRLATRMEDREDASNFYGSDLPIPLTMMSIEAHVQCRVGRAGVSDSKEIAMRPNPEKDRISAVVYVFARDPGGGEALDILERGCLFVPNESDNSERSIQDSGERMAASIPRKTMGVASQLLVQPVRNEKHLLLRLASIVHWKDPDMLISWDTQGSGLGYLIERGSVISSQSDQELSSSSQSTNEIDMVRLLGRTPCAKKSEEESTSASNTSRQATKLDSLLAMNGKANDSMKASPAEKKWKGSGLGTEWDERVGAGAAASSIKGRLVFAVWKIAAEDVKHPNASYLPAIVSTVLNKRIPFHDDLQLTRWYGFNSGRERWRVLHYRLTQATAGLLILDTLDVYGRAVEAAGLSGVEFSQSFPGIRGSQYKVEGVLLRALQSINADERGMKRGLRKTTLSDDSRRIGIDHSGSLSSESKSQTQSPWKARRRSAGSEKNEAVDAPRSDGNYFFFSPSLQDCNHQEALECQALTLEPQSGHYTDPIVVCDFTALYPSLMIAYNLCYSTCAGKLDYHSTRQEMRQQGRTTGRVGPMRYPEARTATVLKHHMKSLAEKEGNEDDNCNQMRRKDRAYAAPTGTIFVSEATLRGVLPQVLEEMLTTRAMLKKAAKQYNKSIPNVSPAVLRQLEARQLAIKMIANVTYGYTSATFSGRSAMPLVADSIVECGRRTLSNAINLANSWGREENGRWRGAEVVYGDTDSLFIRMRGRSVQEAFEFGEAFCKAVTASNPPPVHLKLEKVYNGSIMQTKKKYCGMKYESIEQKKPIFEAKGIETIRRDQCALTQKVLRNALITLFQSGINAVKSYLFRQWSLILSGRLPISEFILTGRVRGRYRGGRVGPVQAVLARRLTEADPGRVVRHKERLAYVIVATPGLTFHLRDCVLTPSELLEQWDAYSIHTTYYITKHVNAAIQRCLGLSPHKVDVNAWYASCPKPRRRIHFWPVTRSGSNVMISSYFGSDICSLCGNKCQANGHSRAVVCCECQKDTVEATQVALSRLKKTQVDAQQVAAVCSSCNLCFEDSSTFAPLKQGRNNTALSVVTRGNPGVMTPITNCTCIDCPNTFERHRLREAELEAVAICQALNLM